MDESATVTRRKSERYAKAEGLRAMGINPYPYKYNPTHTAATLLTLFSHLKPEEKTTQSVCIAGRLLNLRSMGKAAFAHVQDQSGKIQVYFREEDLGENALVFKKCDQGDIIGVVGTMFASKTGEITIYATQVTLLTKAVRDLPDKFHGIKDAELRYRQRYVDLFTHPSVRTVFEQRSKMFHAIREFLSEKGFIEVETPLLQTQYGGANARPFITHINAWNMPMFLSISPELYLKRLVVGGFEKVFTICKNFRNEGVDHSHNPEFTMLEAYFAYADYEDMMKLTEGLFEHACIAVHGKTQIPIQARDKDGKLYETTVDFKAPWPRVSVAQAIEQVCNIKVLTMSVEELKTFCHKEHVEISASATWGDCVSAIFDDLIEHTFVQPTHVYDKPKESSPLCKPHKTDSRLIEQCEPVGAGMELANMYSELNDPIVQRKLLEEQAQQLRAGNQEAQPMDEDFVKAIEYGMPPTGGLGIGLDRFAILLCNQSTIRDVILFPIVKPEHTKNAKPLP